MEFGKNRHKDRTLRELKDDNYRNLTHSEINEITGIHKKNIALVDKINISLNLGYDLFLRRFGWHVRMNMAFDDLVPYMNTGIESVNNLFIESLNSDLEEIKCNAIQRFGSRKRLIELAFKSHQNKEFELSIPALLILSEGIFRELSGADIFSKDNSAKKNNQKIELVEKLKLKRNASGTIAYAIEAAINGDIIGLGFSKDQDKDFPNVLHRNRIIHGADVNYGSEVNSNKALSQFEFITDSIYLAVQQS